MVSSQVGYFVIFIEKSGSKWLVFVIINNDVVPLYKEIICPIISHQKACNHNCIHSNIRFVWVAMDTCLSPTPLSLSLSLRQLSTIDYEDLPPLFVSSPPSVSITFIFIFINMSMIDGLSIQTRPSEATHFIYYLYIVLQLSVNTFLIIPIMFTLFPIFGRWYPPYVILTHSFPLAQNPWNLLKTLDTIGNCHRPSSHLVCLNICIQKQAC